ncbi:MAG: hypothetical protein QG635_1296 [Bacteroidota bacterium]|nr:hypothetical protein [Bacteroidota bacterium]
MTRLIFILLLTILISSGCSGDNSDIKKFTDTYMDILIAREKYVDSIANIKIKEILVKHGYSEKSFKMEFQELTRQYPDKMMMIIDSIRRKSGAEFKNNDKRKGDEE